MGENDIGGGVVQQPVVPEFEFNGVTPIDANSFSLLDGMLWVGANISGLDCQYFPFIETFDANL